jgi:hypothetical protein
LRVLRRLLSLALVAPALASFVACSSSSHRQPIVTTAADSLAALAAKGAAATYSASYAFHQVSPDTTATVQVWRAAPSLRVDVSAGGTTATLLVTSAGSYSCSIKATKRSCLIVAGAGAPVPAPFDVAPVNLFTADLHTLATDTASYDVRSAPATLASGAVPAAQCFDVAGRASIPTAQVPAGRYCFTSAGLLAAATYPTGNTIRLTAAPAATPAPAQFTPYAKPSPLPS